MPAKPRLRLVVPNAENRAVGPTRRANSAYRTREHLTEREEELLDAAKQNRHGHRDSTMILVAYRHGFRASEVCELEWSQIDFTTATMHVRRAKNGKPSTHPIRGDELRILRRLQREAPASAFVFVNERGAPFSPDGFNWMVKRAGQKAGLPFQVHAHMLRHSVGYKLAGDVTTRGPFRTILATRISDTQCATPSYRRNASRIFGGISACGPYRTRHATPDQCMEFRSNL